MPMGGPMGAMGKGGMPPNMGGGGGGGGKGMMGPCLV